MAPRSNGSIIWTEVNPSPLTEEKMTAILAGRQTFREWRLGPSLSIYCWHFDVKNDGNHYIIATMVGRQVASRQVRDSKLADRIMDEVIAEVSAMIITDEEIEFERIEHILEHAGNPEDTKLIHG